MMENEDRGMESKAAERRYVDLEVKVKGSM